MQYAKPSATRKMGRLAFVPSNSASSDRPFRVRGEVAGIAVDGVIYCPVHAADFSFMGYRARRSDLE